MAKIPCPYCHGTGEVPNQHDTIRMKPEEARELLAQAIRTPIPPPARLPRPIRDSELDITMPGTGWFEKHEKFQAKKQRRGGLFLAVMFITTVATLGGIQFCNQRYP